MKTKSILTLLFSLVVFASSAQNIPSPTFEVTDSSVDLSIAIDAVIEDLDLSDVTTNILYDRGWKLGSLENFDGALTSDTVRDHAAWFRQYGSLVTSKVTPTSSLGNTVDWYHYYSVHKLMLPSPIQLVGLTYFSSRPR